MIHHLARRIWEWGGGGWFGRCVILDDRGREVELLDPFRLYFSGSEGVIERGVLKGILDAGAEGSSRKLRLMLLFAVVFFAAMAYFAFWPEYRATGDLRHSLGEALRSPVVYFALGYGVLIVPWQWQAERRIRRRQITKALLERGRCAHCGYNLEGLTGDGGDAGESGNPGAGVTGCPECGCGWRLDAGSIANRAGDEEQARREMIRFGIFVGIIMTMAGLGMGLFYLL